MESEEDDSQNEPESTNLKEIVIEEGEEPDEAQTSDFHNAGTSCCSCDAFRENSTHAWDVLRNFSDAIEENKKLKKENYQLDLQLTESRRYVATLRTNEENLRASLIKTEEQIRNIQSQYNEVLKAAGETKKILDDARKKEDELQKKFENIRHKNASLQSKLGKTLEREQNNRKNLKTALRLLAARASSSETSEENSHKIVKNICEEDSHNIVGYISEEDSHNIAENICEEDPHNIVGNISEEDSHNISENICEEDPHNTVENICEEDSHNIVGNISEEDSYNIVENICEENSHKIVKNICEEDSNNVENICEKDSHKIVESICEEDLNNVENMCEEDSNKIVKNISEEDSHNIVENICEEDSHKIVENMCEEDSNNVENICEEDSNKNVGDDEDFALELSPKITKSDENFAHLELSPKIAESDEDFALELPPSPINGTQGQEITVQFNFESLTREIPLIEIIKSASFFTEMEGMPLIEQIGELHEYLDIEQPTKSSDTNTMLQIVLPNEPNPRLAIHRIAKKYNVNKEEASLLYSRAKRDEAKLRKESRKRQRNDSSDERESLGSGSHKVLKQEKRGRPWVPHHHVVPEGTRFSIYQLEDHRRYVAILANMLRPNPTFRFDQNKLEMQAMDKKLEDERNLFQQKVLSDARYISTFVYPGKESVNLLTHHERMKVRRIIGKRAYQGVIQTIDWDNTASISTEQQTTLNLHVMNILKNGQPKTVTIPDIRQKFTLYHNFKSYLNMLEENFEQKVLITDDPLAYNFAMQNGVAIVLDASTLRHLLCSSWTQRLQQHACRVSVSQKVFQGIKRKLCFILPPLIASRIHQTSVTRNYTKWALKYTLLWAERNKVEPIKTAAHSDCSYQSLLDDLDLGNLSANDTARSSQQSVTDKKRYAIVCFADQKTGSTAEELSQGTQVLIRTNVHGVERDMDRQVSFTSRAEFLPEVGAEKMTDDELLWNQITGILKGSHEHINFRIRSPDNIRAPIFVLQYDRSLPSDFSRFSIEFRKLFYSRMRRANLLFDALQNLNVGEYLIIPSNDGESLQIVKELTTTKEAKDTSHEIDEFSEITSCNASSADGLGPVFDSKWFEHILSSRPISSPNPMGTYWNGLDVHYPLQWHLVHSQIPGALYPVRRKGKGA